MSYRSKIDPRFHEVRPEQVRAYMLDHGWSQRPFPRPQLWVFESERVFDNQKNPIVLTVPVAQEFQAEYVAGLEDLVKALSVWQDGTMTEILGDILRYPAPAANGANGNAAAKGRRPRRQA